MTSKFKLNSTKLGELTFSVSEIDAPAYGYVTEVKIKPTYNNGEVVENSIAKIVLNIIDVQLAKLLKQQGVDTSNIIPSQIEFIAEESTLKQYKAEDMVNKVIDLRNAKVALRWVSRGSSGSWGGLKLIISEFKPVQLK
ncbi:hypothetical protein J2T50_002135 [Streptococcus gallinaceus]|uniref:hypothetical protein n=1 Tax=Streptococcus gallinaceus TaxID=165758 RepID=UPI00209D1C8C|nr:hypothetical protein [Streptococcus gallinaceus]MCP1640396.1 hypothetical protein [Streptococcus gallinaceus]MCP1771179.1 hypothetical protein [Streptococcus gallinaceus]